MDLGVDHSASKDHRKENVVGGAFLGSVAGISVLFGFGMTIAMAKRRDPSFFYKGMLASKEIPESGSALAIRALGWGTLYALSGFSLFTFSVWKLLGVNNLQEFRQKMGSILPTIPKRNIQGRSDFKSLQDLMDYIIEESEKGKKTP